MPAGRFRTIKLLSETFGILLGYKETIEKLDDARSLLHDAYHLEQLSSKEIKDKFGFSCSVSHIPNLLKSLKIPRRSLSESRKLSLLLNKSDMPTGSNLYKSGWFIDQFGNEHYHRSSYELNFYEFLNNSNIKFLSEPLRIEYYDTQMNQTRIAIPDILIGNRIIEIKSNYTYDKQNMIDKIQVYFEKGYEFSLILEHKEYIIDKNNYMDRLP